MISSNTSRILRTAGLVIVIASASLMIVYFVAGLGLEPIYDYYSQLEILSIALASGLALLVVGFWSDRTRGTMKFSDLK